MSFSHFFHPKYKSIEKHINCVNIGRHSFFKGSKMAVFYPTKPQYTTWQWFKFIAIRCIFPPILLWDLFALIVNKLAGSAVGGIILPAQNIDSMRYGNFHSNDIKIFDTNLITHTKHTVITHDGAELDTFEITHMSQINKPAVEQQYIINMVGNGSAYEQHISEMQDNAHALGCNVVGFNYRGVSQSTSRATSANDLVTDGIAQVQRLLDQGVLPEHITLKGHSLGAGIGSLVAAHFHEQSQAIFNDRSFSSLTNVVVGFIRTGFALGNKDATGHSETLGRKLLGWLAKPFIMLALALTGWEMNADEAFKSIPEENREYIVARTRRTERTETVIDDLIISHYASMHLALKDERLAKKAALQGDEAGLAQAKGKFSERKMVSDFNDHNTHCDSLNDLHNRTGKSATIFFREFVKKPHNPQAVPSAITVDNYNLVA